MSGPPGTGPSSYEYLYVAQPIQQLLVVDEWAGPLDNTMFLTDKPEHNSITIERLFIGRLACRKSNYAAERKPCLERKPGRILYCTHKNQQFP